MIDRTHIDAVLADLDARREQLAEEISEIEQAAAALRRLWPVEEATSAEPEAVAEPPTPEPRKLVDIVVDLVQTGQYTQTEIVQRALCERPGTASGSVNTQIYTLMRQGKAHKGEDLILRPIVNGAVSGLPQVAGHSRARYAQYQPN